jgi:putative ATPase
MLFKNDFRSLLQRDEYEYLLIYTKKHKIKLEGLNSTFWRRWTQTIEHFERKCASVKTKLLLQMNGFSLVQQNTVYMNKTGEQHYDIVSAFIKSIRGSDQTARYIGC